MKATAVASVIVLLLAVSAFAQTGSIEGVVKKPDGTPAAGLHVAATRLPLDDSDDTSAETDTDAAGAFAFKSLPPARYTIGSASATAAGGYGEVEVKANATARVEITSAAESRIVSGAVTGCTENAHVLVGKSEPQGSMLVSAPVRSGRYAVALPREGRYFLQAVAKGCESSPALLANDEAGRDLLLEKIFKTAPPEVSSWIAKAAIPLKTVEAGHGFEDMRPIRALIGSARIVALGEATHGTREFFQFKHRMLEYLVNNAGFDVFAIEASFPDALPVNDYVLHGTGDPATALRGMGFWTWDTEEVLALIRWMRAWNEDPAHTRKLRFYGFDMQNPSASVRLLKQFLQKTDPDAIKLFEAVTPALTQIGQAPTKPELVNAATAALDQISARVENSPASDREAVLARKHVDLIRQAVRLFAGGMAGSGDVRDRAMAENIRWLLDHEPAGTKMVIWAHNGHVSTETSLFAPSGSMGAHLRKMYGNDLVVVGAAFNRGSFQAIGGPKRPGLVEHKAEPLDRGAFDRTLADAGPPIFILDFRSATGVARAWLDSLLKHRSIGAFYNDETPKGYTLTMHPLRSFDALYYVRDTTSAVPVGGRKPPPPPVVPAPAAVNLDFASGVKGWTLPSFARESGYDLSDVSDGCVLAPCALMKRTSSEGASAFGAFWQHIDATPYRGKTIRFHAKVRSEILDGGSSGRLWLRVDLPGGGMGFFDNMQNRAPQSLPEWTDMEIVGPVDANAEAIAFGGLLIGKGKLWVDEASLEVVK